MTGDEPGRTQLRNRFALSGHGLKEEELDGMMEEFIDDCKTQSDSFLKVRSRLVATYNLACLKLTESY